MLRMSQRTAEASDVRFHRSRKATHPIMAKPSARRPASSRSGADKRASRDGIEQFTEILETPLDKPAPRSRDAGDLSVARKRRARSAPPATPPVGQRIAAFSTEALEQLKLDSDAYAASRRSAKTRGRRPSSD
jgi:hypothetical protein